MPLGDVIPRVNDEPAGEVLIALCEFYNRGKTQKKLGEYAAGVSGSAAA